jgi:hypothetical protein
LVRFIEVGISRSAAPAISSKGECGFLKFILAVSDWFGTRRDSGTM